MSENLEQEVKRNHKIWKHNRGDTFAKKIVRKIAWYFGYICVPSGYPTWCAKGATTNTIIAGIHEANEDRYLAGKHDGMTEALNMVSYEIKEFEKDR